MADSHAQTYYATGPADLSPVVLDALVAAGKPIDPIDINDLAALDEFHGLGRAATLALARLAGVKEGERVLDVGAGIGGPARTLARHFGARVTALDPPQRFCSLADEINRRAELDDAVEVVQADARKMPFEDGSFDLAMTQAVWPSIEGKVQMLAEVRRVLRPGGRLAIYEAVTGPTGGEIEYPVPWADNADESFVISSEEIGRLAASAGFVVEEMLAGVDVIGLIGPIAGSNEEAMSFGVEGVGLSLLMPEFETRMATMARNVESGRVELAMALLVRD